MKQLIKKYWLLILVLILAIFLRFYRLGTYPALNADEASNGYDAYSLIQTGMDQHGHPWPISFQSFNDYKPGLYVYLIIPFVKVLGLTALAVRIPGAVAGVLSVFFLYLLVKESFSNKRLGELAAFFLAISPWHIQFSRGGWEVNVSTLFIILGSWLILNFVKTKSLGTILLSALFLVMSLYTYHATRVVAPLLVLIIGLIYRKEIFIRKNLGKIIAAVIFGLVLLIPLVKDLISPGALSRVAGVGLFADPGPINRIEEQRGEHSNPNNILAKLIHNKPINYGLAFAANWVSHFSGEFLFMTGDSIQRNKVPETGEMYLFDVLFIIFGLIGLARIFGYDDSDEKKAWSFIFLWLLIAPIASALTFQAPNALRAQNMVIPLVIISAYGCYQIIRCLIVSDAKWLKVFGFIFFGLFLIWGFARYEHMYWIHMSKEYPYSSQYGVEELVSYISQNGSKYQNVFITTRYDQPYILFLFYLKYPPQKFQGNHILTVPDEFGFSTVANFDKYHFGSIDFKSLSEIYPNSLIIGTPQEIPHTAKIIKRVFGSNGFEYFDIVQN